MQFHRNRIMTGLGLIPFFSWKVKLSLSEESEWMQYFNEQKQKANDLQSQITQTDREIDRMVYDLYGLTDEDIQIVEESVGWGSSAWRAEIAKLAGHKLAT